jgi:hypothetical protein
MADPGVSCEGSAQSLVGYSKVLKGGLRVLKAISATSKPRVMIYEMKA